MPDIIIQFLHGRITQELLNLYFRAYTIIEYFEREDNYDLIENLLLDIDNIDAQIVIDRIYYFHIDQMVNIISEYSITLHEGYQLLDLIKIIEGLLYLEDSEETDFIMQSIENSEDNVETLSILLGLMTMEDPLVYAEWIKDCHGELLIKIYQNAKKLLPTIEEDNNIDNSVNEKIKVLKTYKENPKYNKSLVFSLIKNGLHFNLPLGMYINLLKDSLFSDIYTTEDKGINLALLSFMSDSKDIHKDLNEALHTHLNDLTEVSSYIASFRQYAINV